LVTKQILDQIAGLSDRVSIEEVNFILEKDRAAALGITGVPAIAVLKGDHDTRIRFLGAPGGYEFVSLIEAILLAGGTDSGLSQESKTLIAEHVAEPLDIKVFVTPTCPHCPRAVTLAHRMAFEHPLIHATCIEATEFMDLSRQYRVTGVPKTVVNGTIEILGAVPEETFVRTVLQLPAHATDADQQETPSL
jgi:glutaredoxin-like protein